MFALEADLRKPDGGHESHLVLHSPPPPSVPPDSTCPRSRLGSAWWSLWCVRSSPKACVCVGRDAIPRTLTRGRWFLQKKLGGSAPRSRPSRLQIFTQQAPHFNARLISSQFNLE